MILSTRKNIENSTKLIRSFFDTSSGETELEVLLGLDDDDDTRFELMETFGSDNRISFTVMPRVGYFGLSKFFSVLAEKSTGSLLIIATDRSLFVTQDWDKTLLPYEKKFIVTSPSVIWNEDGIVDQLRSGIMVPIVSRKWYDVLGKICDQPHMDSCIGWTIGNVGKIRPEGERLHNRVCFMSNFFIEHDRRRGGDFTKDGQSNFFSEEAHCVRTADAQKIYNFLTNNPEWIP